MIARVDFVLADRPITATLGDDLRWSVEPANDAFQAMMNVTYAVTDDSPSRGVPGHAEANAAAADLRGTVQFPPARPPEGPGPIDY